MKQDKILSMIGLAQRAGKVVSGEFSTEKAVKQHKAIVVVVAGDSSDNTKKNFMNMCTYYGVPMYTYSDKIALGHAIGKEFRASLAVVDENFGNRICEQFEQFKQFENSKQSEQSEQSEQLEPSDNHVSTG